MAYTTIDDPTLYFNTVLYTGTGATHNITGVGFQPDWVWIKNRSITANHHLFDIARGATKYLLTNVTNAEATDAQQLQSFDADGFTVGTNGNVNGSGNNIVAWNWLGANASSSNTDGSITSSVSANTTAGFSIVSYTGTGANATVGHGLGSALDMVIVKNRDDVANWKVWHNYLSGTQVLELNNTDAVETPAVWNSTIPTSSVFSVGTQNTVNGSGDNIIAYCFAEKKGYSKFGSYTGNGNADGTFVYTGFKPAFVITKKSSNTGNWLMYDNKRDSDNVVNATLNPNLSNAESSVDTMDFTAQGFKLRRSLDPNTSATTYIYMAFAENPFVSSTGIPTTAR